VAADIVKCPHCFGEKPAAAKVCLHCGRDERGYGPIMATGNGLMVPDNSMAANHGTGKDLKLHMLVAIGATVSGFLIMLSSGLGSLLFVSGIVLLLATRGRMWWRQRRRMF